MFSPPQKGFTLIELLVVIGILAVLATTTALILNPAELLAQSRDTKRINDLNSLNSAINLYQVQGGVLASSNIVYISLPDSSPTCANWPNLPTLPQSPVVWTYSCASNPSSTTNGWIPINFTNIAGVTLAALPVDPVNSPTDLQYYTFIKGSWNLTARLESSKLIKSTALNDGGSDPLRYEEGSDKSLGSKATGLVGYWPMDEGSGQDVKDYSDSNNNGTLGVNSLASTDDPSWGVGRIGGGLVFDGSSDYINTLDNASLNFGTGSFSAVAWIKLSTSSSIRLVNKFDGLTYVGWVLDANNTAPGSLRTRITDGTNNLDYSASSNLNDGNWHSVVLSVNKGSTSGLRMYVDGQQVGVSQNPAIIGNVSNTASLGFGTIPSISGNYLNGSIDDVRIYNRALSASEIQAIYNATK